MIEIYKDGPVTYNHSKEMVDFAANCLVTYFESFGAKRPGELEDDFCGQPGELETMLNIQGRWRESPFYPALGYLVDAGTVVYWIDEIGDVWYDLKEDSQPLELDGQKDARHSA